MQEPSPKATANAAVMLLQAVTLALLNKGILGAEDVLCAFGDVVEAYRSTAADQESEHHDHVLRIVAQATEAVSRR